MGYRTDFTLNAYPLTKECFEQITDKLLELNRYFEDGDTEFDGDEGSWSDEDDTWYEHEEDMLEVSRAFPNVRFELCGWGESRDDVWRQFFVAGKMLFCPAYYTYWPFVEEQLALPKKPDEIPPGEEGDKRAFSPSQLNRLEAIDNAMYQCLLTLLEKSEREFPWDKDVLKELVDELVASLKSRGYKIRRPHLKTGAEGNVSIEEYEE